MNTLQHEHKMFDCCYFLIASLLSDWFNSCHIRNVCIQWQCGIYKTCIKLIALATDWITCQRNKWFYSRRHRSYVRICLCVCLCISAPTFLHFGYVSLVSTYADPHPQRMWHYYWYILSSAKWLNDTVYTMSHTLHCKSLSIWCFLHI